MSGHLKKLSDKLPINTLKFQLHRHLSTIDAHRGTDTVHASELTKEGGICPRFYAINSHMPDALPERSTTTSENATWEIGRMWQDKLVNYFSEIGIGISNWICDNGNCKLLYKHGRRPKECVQCGCTSFTPSEPRFVSDKIGASCGVDMLVLFPGETLWEICEIKTIAPDEFKKLAAPLAEHRLRTNFYLRIVAESKEPITKNINTKKARVLYTTKGGYGVSDMEVRQWGLGEYFSPFKEFEITRDDKATNHMAERAKIAFDYRNGKIGMPYGICATAFEDRAKSCPRSKTCFGGEYPPTHAWS
ncbi:hypothetical protein EVC30_033 [Rhizobium phage RHph_Y1_11]|nr:hypothetical protein EVC30_033 [Rhizobium phage RHph_Y1_11]